MVLNPPGHLGYEILGAGIGLGAASLGAALFTVAGAAAIGGCEESPCLATLYVGATGGMVAALALVPAGVTLAGDRSGGAGSYWGSVAGSATVLAPASLALVLSRPKDRSFLPIISGSVILSLAGAVIGYRVSAPDAPQLGFDVEPDGRRAVLSVRGQW